MASESVPLATDTHEGPSETAPEQSFPTTAQGSQPGSLTFPPVSHLHMNRPATSSTTANLRFATSLFGPQATTAELQLQFVPPFIYSILLLYRAVHLALLESALHYIIFFTLTFDITGGVLTTATLAGKAAYHHHQHQQQRSSSSPHSSSTTISLSQDHVLFSVAHAVHVLVVAVMFRDILDVTFFLQVSTLLLLSSAVVMSVPDYLKNVTAFIAVLNAVFLDLYVWGPTKSLEWFVPFLFIKVCVGYHVPPVTMDVHPATVEGTTTTAVAETV